MFEFDYPSSGRPCSNVLRFCVFKGLHLVGSASGSGVFPVGHTTGSLFLVDLPDNVSKRLSFDIFSFP